MCVFPPFLKAFGNSAEPFPVGSAAKLQTWDAQGRQMSAPEGTATADNAIYCRNSGCQFWSLLTIRGIHSFCKYFLSSESLQEAQAALAKWKQILCVLCEMRLSDHSIKNTNGLFGINVWITGELMMAIRWGDGNCQLWGFSFFNFHTRQNLFLITIMTQSIF